MNEPNFEQPGLFEKTPVILCLVVFAVSAALLVWQGRVWWCQAGDMVPWSWDIWTTHNSQHVIDPYLFTHVLHGILEFWLIGLLFKRMPLAWRLLIAVVIEATWEVAENSSYIIERYRTVTLSLDYFGDSIINSLTDIVACATGFTIAYKLKFWKSLALFLATEAILILWIRDSLLINIVMLLYPIEAIKAWQMAGH
ncbi:MAG: DUF2585 family protein [Pyrinomonadaceae bacterium]